MINEDKKKKLFLNLKSKENMSNSPSRFRQLKSLGKYFFKYKKYFLLSLLFVLLSGAVTLILPFAIRLVIDHGFQHEAQNFFHIHSYFLILFFIVAILAASSGGLVFFLSQLGENIVKDLRIDVFNHLMKLSPGFYDKTHSGELVSRLATDANEIKSALRGSVSIALRNIITITGGIVMMFIISFKLSLIALFTVPFLILSLIYWGHRLKNRAKLTQDCIAKANLYASDYLGAIRSVQAFVAEKRAMKRFADLVQESYHLMRKSLISRAILTASAMFLVFGGIVLILWIGAYDIMDHKITAGQLSQFMLYAVLGGSALGQLSIVFGQLQQAFGACERLIELLHEKTQIHVPEKYDKLILPIKGDIRFSNVSFSYPSAKDHIIFKNLFFYIQAGETVAFVGASGAGKTTIFSLLLHFYDIEGKIFLDGQDISLLPVKDVRRQIGYVPQDVMIFKGNFYENIAFGVENYSYEEIVEAAKIAQAYEFIMKYKDGFETELGERGVILSGGQKQRIGIARAILQKTPILLLDEATSALDTENETLVQKALDEIKKDRTTLVIAHRLSTIMKADRIFVLGQGKIIESGTHQELLKKQGFYAKLIKLQLDKSLDPKY